jgi:hypothetical protein
VNRLSRVSVVLALVVVGTTACDRAPATFSSAQLEGRMVSAASVPPGVTVDPIDPADAGPGHPAPASTPLPCSALMVPALFFIDDPGARPTSGARVNLHASSPAGWLASERLMSYARGKAHRAVADLKEQVKRCPVLSDTTGGTTVVLPGRPWPGPSIDSYTLRAGPKLGDESVQLRKSSRLIRTGEVAVSDAIVIRSGNTLLILSQTAETIGPSPRVSACAEAAYKAFQAA